MSTNYMRDKVSRNQMLMPWAESETVSSGDAAVMLQRSTWSIRILLEEGELQGYQLRPGVPKSPWRVYRKSVEKYAARLNATYSLESDAMRSARSSGSPGSTDAKGVIRR